MKYLFIDTSTSHLIISTIINDEIVSYYDEEIINGMSEHVLLKIEEQFNLNNLKASSIDAIFVSDGPGSFTGIRVGLTIAKVYAWSLNIKVINISSLEVLATTNSTKKYLVPLIDARRGFVFSGIYDRDLNVIFKDSYISISELKDKINDECELISYDEFEFETVKPNIDILKIIKKHENDKGINPHKLNPNYLKLTEAEQKLMMSNDKRN